jgi:hypothetical protein
MKIINAFFPLFIATFLANESNASSMTHQRQLALPLIAGFEPSTDVTDLVRVNSSLFLHILIANTSSEAI